ncbi:hypothetical protein HJB84_03645 [Rhizobium sp. NZLR1b]|uniref:hypothetical protein n=1 Tax=unclassified Rhizobium TaxID=2613769 RepID=UPI001C82BEBB|nr:MULTISPECIES: hypothetical protein [unclassified Rhizobium]MBX5157320.1 hypothetical protein [Rhizobium sp. NZLR8]MBX5168962.1 hypothetical protein [Rhizobium sp. NZLR1b]MBX5184032.1 hypothetical protein [Rhizobium sp. NZLR5]MBX5188905.1 hypothetical protein [Rhizobium sp. NZLR3b]MBX5195264.1 hypothetical protein [Rhizobium sp. NZLR10]
MRTGKEKVSRIPLAPVLLAFSLAAGNVFLAPAAYALSELHKVPGQPTNDAPAAQGQSQPQSGAAPGVPMADPLVNSQNNQGVDKTPGAQDAAKPAEVIYDISKVPEPVRKMREQIVEAAASGDLERLRPLMGAGTEQTQVTVGEPTDDPIGTLKDLSGDPDGDEILAIMLDIISTGFVHVGQGTADDMYVWPYFAEKDLKSLTPPERVELLRIVTAGDLSDMQEFGGYNFYRLGITPQGKWKFFTAGD